MLCWGRSSRTLGRSSSLAHREVPVTDAKRTASIGGPGGQAFFNFRTLAVQLAGEVHTHQRLAASTMLGRIRVRPG